MALLFLEFIGTTEMLVIMIAALVLFGPRKLPELGRSLGKHLGEFKRASEDFKRTWESEVDMERLDRDTRTEQAALHGETINSNDTPQLSTSETSIARSSDDYDQSYGSDSSSSYDSSYSDGNYYGDSSSTGYTAESTDSNSDTTVVTTTTDNKEVDDGGDATVVATASSQYASSQAAPDADETVVAPAASSKNRA